MDYYIEKKTMEDSPDYLENIRRKLSPHLPASIQAYNSVVLALSDDGIERRVVSAPDQLQCSVLVLNREQACRVMISMFSSSETDDDLRKLLEENIDWTEEIDFVVSLIKELGTVLTHVDCRDSIRDIWDLLRVWLQRGPQVN